MENLRFCPGGKGGEMVGAGGWRRMVPVSCCSRMEIFCIEGSDEVNAENRDGAGSGGVRE